MVAEENSSRQTVGYSANCYKWNISLNPHINLLRRLCYFHCIDEETEVQRFRNVSNVLWVSLLYPWKCNSTGWVRPSNKLVQLSLHLQTTSVLSREGASPSLIGQTSLEALISFLGTVFSGQRQRNGIIQTIHNTEKRLRTHQRRDEGDKRLVEF